MQAGERVKVKTAGQYLGATGVVMRFDGAKLINSVQLDNDPRGALVLFGEYELEPQGTGGVNQQGRLQVWDQVKVTAPGHAYDGMAGVVMRYDEAQGTHVVQLDALPKGDVQLFGYEQLQFLGR